MFFCQSENEAGRFINANGFFGIEGRLMCDILELTKQTNSSLLLLLLLSYELAHASVFVCNRRLNVQVVPF